MPRHLRTVLGLLLTTTALQLGLATTPSVAADQPTHSVTVTGTGVSTYPAFDPAVDRYAVRTTEATGGSVTVTASTTDPDGIVTVDGRPVESGSPLELSGLEEGDEVSVAIRDAGGTSHQSFIYLPAGFPELAAAGARPAGSPPYVFLGLGSFLSVTSYATLVDEHGVPVFVRSGLEPHDFKAQPNGPAYTYFEPVKDSPDDTDYGYRVLELDDRYQVTGTRRLSPDATAGIVPDDTDFHDLQYLDDGRVVMVGYHHGDRANGEKWLDAVIEIVEPDGTVDFAWSSRDHVADPDSEGYVFGLKAYRDYAHINSVEMQPNGDLVASFRNLGQVMRIATTAHDGFAPGDVVWKMGGADGDFQFLDDPYGGFCAQHDARILPDGHLLVFDNGSRSDGTNALGGQTADMCADPANPGGTRIARAQTRVVEYALDEVAHTATLVRSFVPQDRYSAFAGNAQRLPGGDTLVGWSDARYPEGSNRVAPVTSEVTAAGDERWSLTAQGWFSYRAFTYDAPDAIAPEIEIVLDSAAPHPAGTLVVDYTCTDRGGSNLQTCEGPVPSGTPWPIDPAGFEVTATDGAGNGTADSVSVVTPARRPRLDIRTAGAPWRDHHVRISLGRAGATASALVRIRNREQKGALPVRGAAGNRAFAVRYFHGGRDITRRVVRGAMTTPVLHRGESWTLRVEVRRTGRAARGDHLEVPVRATSAGGLTGRVEARLRAR
ncbi:MAG: hypothetical protein JWO76_2148 [Nocardioides sp.]|nr:hypothetical protein [Nocardioides sp.]